MNLIIAPTSATPLAVEPHNIPHALRQNNIPLHQWGKAPFKTIEELQESTRTESVNLVVENNRLVLHVNVAVAYVRYPGPTLRELYEVHVFDGDPHREYRRDFDGIAETLHRGESTEDGLHRCVQEELDFFDRRKYQVTVPVSNRQNLGPLKSDHYLGLLAVFHRTKFVVTITPDLYTREYRRYDPKKRRTSIFRWKDI